MHHLIIETLRLVLVVGFILALIPKHFQLVHILVLNHEAPKIHTWRSKMLCVRFFLLWDWMLGEI